MTFLADAIAFISSFQMQMLLLQQQNIDNSYAYLHYIWLLTQLNKIYLWFEMYNFL